MVKLIIGANGRIGRLVVADLVQAETQPLRVFVRDAEKAYANFGSAVEVAVGDLNDPDSIRPAMEGVSGVLLCSPVDPYQVRQHNAVIDAAKGADKPFIVKLSGLATFSNSFVDSGNWHAQTEAHLASSGLPYTCLHPYFFMQNLGFQLEKIRETGLLSSGVPEAAIAMVDVRDIASVIVRLLHQPDLAANATLPLTCGEALTYVQMAEHLSHALGRKVTFHAQTLSKVEENLRRSGQPEWHIQLLLQFNRAFNEGLGSQTHAAVAEILGRPPITFEDFLTSIGTSAEGEDPFPS